MHILDPKLCRDYKKSYSNRWEGSDDKLLVHNVIFHLYL